MDSITKKTKAVICNPPWPGEGTGARSNVRWPHRRGDKVLAFPIYLAYSSSLLKREGFDVTALDAVEKEYGIFRFVEEMKRIGPDVIFMEISAPSLNYDLETAFNLKKELKDCLIVFCGPHLSYAHKEIIDNYNFVDACIRGEFEQSILDICTHMEEKRVLSDVTGVTYKGEDGNARINPDRPLIEDVDGLPFPDRESFRIEKYQQAFYGGKKTALMISSRGCPYYCDFCLWPDTFLGPKHRQRSIRNVVDEIGYLIKNHGIDEVFFDDDTFAISNERMQEMSQEIIKRGIKISWVCMGRVNLIDEETLKMMKKSGCTQIFYGFESGSKEILNSIKKGITLEQSLKAVKMTQKAGLAATGSFIIGLPKESNETAKETIRFAIKLGADFVQFTLAAPFPGTRYWEEAKQKNLLELNSLEDLAGCSGPIVHTENLTKEELAGWQRKAYIRYYTHPKIIWKNIIKIRNLRELRRVLKGIKSVLARIFFYNG
ncbi:radical SAM protein [Candidatus Woesearchaeota archaeon]|nr:radical SAM protein [Candidatus Woesearchaeota archaeon]